VTNNILPATKALLDGYLAKTTPGIQYMVANDHSTLFEFAGGWADIQTQRRMTLATTLMAYSMTKTFTALAILQLAEQKKIGLDDPIGEYPPHCPYPGTITIRQVVTHTSGIPNPIPLKWIHSAETHDSFDEHLALAQVLEKYPKIAFKPGAKFAYSNIGYWLLGMIIEEVTQQRYVDYVTVHILQPLTLPPQELGFKIPDLANHAKGYLGRYSIMNLARNLITDPEIWGGYEGNWHLIKNFYVNGPAFGGLVGSAPAFICFLQDQLRESSVLLNSGSKGLFYQRQKTSPGVAIPMSLGWHVGDLKGTQYFFKEGGGGGFHSEMRIYPTRKLASVILVNSTEFNSNRSLSELDEAFMTPSRVA
jgi:D-alanyl-D-alanine carboxypeptidase